MPVTKKTDTEKTDKKTTKTAEKVEKKTEKATRKEIKKTVKKTVKKLLKAQEKTEKVLKKATKGKDVAAATQKIVDLIEKTLSDGKAEDILVIELVGKTAIADYLVIATGRAPRHVTALAEQVQLRLKKTGIPAVLEGGDTGDWVIVDAGDVIVHVFHPETRELYCIEELWGEETPRKKK